MVVEGEADVAAAPTLEEHLAAALAEGPEILLVDLTATTFVDSTAIRALVEAQHAAREAGGSLRLVSQDPRITNTLGYAGVDRELPAYPSRNEALFGGHSP